MKRIFSTIFIVLQVFPALAQENLSPGVNGTSSESASSTLTQVVFNSGFFGLLIWLLLFATSTVAIAVAIRLMCRMRKSCFINEKCCEQADGHCENGEIETAYGIIHKRVDAYSHAMNAVFANFHEAIPHEDAASNAVDKFVRAQSRLINILQTCGNIAPMLGLLGTVTGMVAAFMGLGTALGPEKASVLAISISQALYTTAAGLLISVPCLALVTYARNTLEKRVQVLNDALTKTLLVLKRKKH